MNCPKCDTEMEPDPEDSSEYYCSTCNYGYRIGQSLKRKDEGKTQSFKETQERLTAYADELEEIGVYIHRDLSTLPKEYVEVVNSYLKEAAKNIKLRKQVEEFELKYEKARGELFDCLHEKSISRR